MAVSNSCSTSLYNWAKHNPRTSGTVYTTCIGAAIGGVCCGIDFAVSHQVGMVAVGFLACFVVLGFILGPTLAADYIRHKTNLDH